MIKKIKDYEEVCEKSDTISEVYSEDTIKAITASLEYNEFAHCTDKDILSYWKEMGKDELKGMEWALKDLIKDWKSEYSKKINSKTEVRAFVFDKLCEFRKEE